MRHLSWAHLTTASSETWAQGAARGISCSVAWLPAAHIKSVFKPLDVHTRPCIYWVKFSPVCERMSSRLSAANWVEKSGVCKALVYIYGSPLISFLLKFAHLVFFWMLCAADINLGERSTPLAASSLLRELKTCCSPITGRVFNVFISTLWMGPRVKSRPRRFILMRQIISKLHKNYKCGWREIWKKNLCHEKCLLWVFLQFIESSFSKPFAKIQS